MGDRSNTTAERRHVTSSRFTPIEGMSLQKVSLTLSVTSDDSRLLV